MPSRGVGCRPEQISVMHVVSFFHRDFFQKQCHRNRDIGVSSILRHCGILQKAAVGLQTHASSRFHLFHGASSDPIEDAQLVCWLSCRANDSFSGHPTKKCGMKRPWNVLAPIAWSKHQSTLEYILNLSLQLFITFFFKLPILCLPCLPGLPRLPCQYVYFVDFVCLSHYHVMFCSHSGALSILRRTLQVIALAQLWELCVLEIWDTSFFEANQKWHMASAF